MMLYLHLVQSVLDFLVVLYFLLYLEHRLVLDFLVVLLDLVVQLVLGYLELRYYPADQ